MKTLTVTDGEGVKHPVRVQLTNLDGHSDREMENSSFLFFADFLDLRFPIWMTEGM